MWIYGGFTGLAIRISGTGTVLYQKTEAAYDRHRTVYPTQRHGICKRNRRQSGSDFESGCHVAADESKRYDSGDNSVGTIDPRGREKAILSGANVVMPNLSPVSVRKNYMLYDNKLCIGDEAAECRKCLDARIRSIGYEIVTDRGDYREF